MKRGEPPDIFAYLSYRAFLRDWFKARKRADRRYSHRLFAQRAGVASPSLLSEVIAGRRNLTPATSAGFASALGLDREQARFFQDLQELDRAATPEEKAAAWEKVAASRRFRSARPLDAGMVRYLSSWYYPATRELALRADFRLDPAWVAARLRPPISRAQARDALETLQELGMLVPDGEGGAAPADVSVATPHEIADLIVHNYHQGMLARAAEALSTTPAEERHYLGVTVAIPRDLVPTLKAELDAFQERLLHLCDDRSDRAEQVYQLNLQLLPLSAPPEDG
jgi:uncharacterized protein (TIGR02147 family)